MELQEQQAIVESMLFAYGKEISIKNFMNTLELNEDEVKLILENLMEKYNSKNSGIELVRVNDNYQLVTKKDYYEYVYPLIDNRIKPTLSNAALETLAIIAYNNKITRAQIEDIRGVNSDGPIYKLLEFELIKTAGKLDIPGRPMSYTVTNNFFKMFGLSSLEELPELPRYKLDENEQIVLDDFIEEKKEEN